MDADPYAAEKFYYKMGCYKIGDVESTVIKGRLIPQLRFDISTSGQRSRSVEIRIATEVDVPGIRKAIRSSIEGLASNDYSAEIIQSWGADTLKAHEKQKLAIREGKELTWVAVQTGKIVGFSAFSPQTQELRAVYIAADVARQGLGTKLLERVEKKAYELCLSSLKMHSSITAVPFYKSHGYSVLGEIKHTLSTGVQMTAIEMKKNLDLNLNSRGSFEN
jgi:N-acetylglutamate synthase-like GNAT family acetyltransferase